MKISLVIAKKKLTSVFLYASVLLLNINFVKMSKIAAETNFDRVMTQFVIKKRTGRQTHTHTQKY